MTGDAFRRALDDLKRRPLEDLVAPWHYVRDPVASCRSHLVLRAEGQPKLVVRRQPNGHWVYFNTLDPADCGTVIDFLRQRGWSFADIRALHDATLPLDSVARRPRAEAGTGAPPRDWVAAVWQAAHHDPAPAWLRRRGITAATLDHYRPLIRTDLRGHVLCAHRDATKTLTGFEITPPDGHRRFATGGHRTLFALRAAPAPDIHTLVVTESAIDALSLAQHDGWPDGTVLLSTAGAPSPAQHRQIRRATEILPNLAVLVLAQDGDHGGDRQAKTLADAGGWPDTLRITRRRPPDGMDWNDLITPTPRARCNTDAPATSQRPGSDRPTTPSGKSTNDLSPNPNHLAQNRDLKPE